MTDQIDTVVHSVVDRYCDNANSNDTNYFWGQTVKDLEEIDTDSLVDDIFNNPIFSTFAMNLYGKSGRFIADNLDLMSDGQGKCDKTKISTERLQTIILEALTSKIRNYNV